MRKFYPLACLFAVAAVAAADEKPNTPAPGKAIPAATPLTVTLKGTAQYTLDLGGMTAAEFKKALQQERLPAPPKVDLTLVIENTSKEAVGVWTSGDPVTIELTLTGKGAQKVVPMLFTTTDFRLPMGVEVAAGKTVELPVKALVGGFRGIGHYWYWTQPGEYELVATLKSGVSPAPKGAQEQDGFGVVQVASKPFKITVTEKK